MLQHKKNSIEPRQADGSEGPSLNKRNLLFDNRYLFWLLWPLFTEQLFMFAVGVADSVMVATVGEDAVSAVSLVDSVMMLIIALMAALSTGGAVVVGQLLGQKKTARAINAADQLMLAALLISLIITGLLYLLQRPILTVVFGDITPEVMHHCQVYYRITVASVPFIAIYNAGSALFRSVGNSRISMLICFFMNVINIPGNYILLHIFHMEAAGVALPTLAARAFSALAVVICLRNQNLRVHLSRRPVLKPDLKLIGQILRIGIPNGIENSMFQLGKLILLSFISSFGTVSIAANAVGNTVAGVAILPGISVGLGVVSVISQCAGAGDYRQVRYYTKKLVGLAYIMMTITNALGIILLPAILHVYGLSDETSALASQLLLFNFVCSIICWPLSFTFPNMLRACSDVMYTMVVGVGSMWIFRICAAFFIGGYLGFGVLGVWIAMVLDWVVRSICFILRYRSGKWMHESLRTD